MNKIGILKNPVQEYEWGSRTAIQSLIDTGDSSERPMAELWMGAHPRASSEVLVNGRWEPLTHIIKRDPDTILGKSIAAKYSNSLPFLFKILAAERPLSIQVHPDLEQAGDGFIRENNLGISLDAPNRNYRDQNHKPEILCALTRFQGLKGFRKPQEIIALLEKVLPSELALELNDLKKEPGPNGLRRFFGALLSMEETRQKQVVSRGVKFAEKYAGDNEGFEWMIKLNEEYPGDMGIFSPAILNLVHLEPGEAVYLPSGELHAYLHGVGIELMANSDNVLRGGLTSKHVDVPELLEIVNFEPAPSRKVKPVKSGDRLKTFVTPAKEFLLSVISVDKRQSFASPQDRGVEVLICMEGEAGIKDLGSGEVLALNKGVSVIVPAAVPRYRIEGSAMLYMACVP
ncbi:MAG: mannose-6-phosphate isomerase, class I [Desulfobacterales bacterium]|nr:mannose-6-phosphate isomerase, class I [Desulfobacterales bacterium]